MTNTIKNFITNHVTQKSVYIALGCSIVIGMLAIVAMLINNYGFMTFILFGGVFIIIGMLIAASPEFFKGLRSFNK